jgi:glycosyltransferase involved in cell wall biosynthesis
MTIQIPIFGLDWHIRQSPAQRILVGEPLHPFIQFEQIAWDGETLPALNSQLAKSNTLIFFQLPPPPKVLENPELRIVWIPMWDEARGYPQEWWQNLPKNLRVVSFSGRIGERCDAVGLDKLEIRFFQSPENRPKANWDNGRTLFYWNRSGLVGKPFLSAFCRSLQIDNLIYLRNETIGLPAGMDYPLPQQLGGTRIHAVEAGQFLPQTEYLDLFHQANIFLAPRTSEGVGLFLLEAMAQGCAVFAYDAPTMNEYISHKNNGYLLRRYGRTGWNRICGGADRRVRELQSRILHRPKPLPHPISEWQDWREIRKLDLRTMGDRARQTQSAGYQEWIASIPRYASFILDW